jgi:hypothetical protein
LEFVRSAGAGSTSTLRSVPLGDRQDIYFIDIFEYGILKSPLQIIDDYEDRYSIVITNEMVHTDTTEVYKRALRNLLAALPNATAMVNKAEMQYLLASQICAILEWEYSIHFKKFYLEKDFDENASFSVFLDCVKNTAMMMTVAGSIGLMTVVESCMNR